LADGRAIYIRFRHDELSLRIAPEGGTIDDAIAAPPALTIDDHEEKRDGLIELDEMLALTGLRLSPELEAHRDRL
jgi:hypothetical protein